LPHENAGNGTAGPRKARDIAFRQRIEVDGEEDDRQAAGDRLRRAPRRLAAGRKGDVDLAPDELGRARGVSLGVCTYSKAKFRPL
jgi:hypothetical protein